MTQLADINTAVEGLPAGLQHALYDREGQLILSSQPERHVIDVSDRPYFQRLTAGEHFVIQPMVTERLSGDQVIIVARRMESLPATDGTRVFFGVATIAIPVAYLNEIADALLMPQATTLTLVGLDGWLIARAPPAPPSDLSGTPNFANFTSAPNGTYAATSPIDRQQRIIGFWRIEGWPVVAISGVDLGTVMTQFRRSVQGEVAILIPLLLGVAVMIVWLFRLMVVDERRAKALAAAQERSEFLLKEIHHRVKNNLQAVMSLIRLQRLPPDVTEALQGRISAMVEVHQEIFSGETLDRIKATPYMQRLVGNIARGYDDRVTIDLELADVDLSGDLAMQVGLVTNELLTNAFKHAFQGGRKGRIEVILAQADADHLRLTIRDDGVGVDPATQKTSMGSKLIGAFVAQMRGTMTVDSDQGYCTTITFPTTPDDPEVSP